MQSTRVRFAGSADFQTELKRRVAAYFESQGSSPRDAKAMYGKTAVILAVTAVSYLLLVFWAFSWWQVLPLSFSLALGMAGIGFSVQHDANHGGYSGSRAVNRLLAASLDLIGGSSYVWYWKHNIVHHTYTNISGLDVDLEIEPFLRLAPDQPLLWHHKFQHIYIWGLYGLLPTNWQFWADFRDLKNGSVGSVPFPRPSPLALAATLAGKAFFFGWALVLPLMLHPAWIVLSVFAATSFMLGVLLTTTFQLAHCVDSADLVTVESGAAPLAVGWAEHQLRTTSNFAPKSRILTWYLGGLNYQVEHHLFPKICHVHYPALSPIVAAACRDFNMPYHSEPKLTRAIASHTRRLRALGHPLASLHAVG